MDDKELDVFKEIMRKASQTNPNDETPEEYAARFNKTFIESATSRKISLNQNEPQKPVFVVVTHYMGGTQAEQVFATAEAAETYIKSRNDKEGLPTIQRFPILGKIENAEFVYTVEVPDRDKDSVNLVGIYGNYDDAKKIAGKDVPVTRKEIRKYKGVNHAS